MVVLAGDEVAFGPSALSVPHLDSATFWTAFTVLVVPQVPPCREHRAWRPPTPRRLLRQGRRGPTCRLGDDLRFREPVASTPSMPSATAGRPDRPLFGARTAAPAGHVLLPRSLALGTGLAGSSPLSPPWRACSRSWSPPPPAAAESARARDSSWRSSSASSVRGEPDRRSPAPRRFLGAAVRRPAPANDLVAMK